MSILSKLAAAGRLSEKTAASGDKIILDSPEAQKAAKVWAEGKLKAKDGEAAMDAAKADLSPLVLDAWLAGNAGRAKPESSVIVSGLVLATFASKWSASDSAVSMLVKDLTRERYSFTIDGDLIPPDKADAFVEGLLDLGAKLGISEAIKARGAVVPVSEFNSSRFTRLTLDENRALEVAGLGTQLSYRLK